VPSTKAKSSGSTDSIALSADFSEGAQASRPSGIATDQGYPNLRKNNCVGVADILQRDALIFKVAGTCDPHTRAHRLHTFFGSAFLECYKVPTGLKAVVSALEGSKQHFLD
jgi:hypothetical protein